MAKERKSKERRSRDRRSLERRSLETGFSGEERRKSQRREGKRRIIKTDRRFKGGRTLRLGAMYEQGSVVPQDYMEAFRCYKKAAEVGNAEAQNCLGKLYYQGKGVKQNDVQALMWFSLSGANGMDDAVHNIRVVKKKLKPDQIAKARDLAAEWREKHQGTKK